MILLDNKYIESMKDKKNLLAFSGGTDSSALANLLLENDIPFDLIMVNYNIREQSKKEVEYAREFAVKNNLKFFLKTVDFSHERSNFEKKARDLRYSFFDQTIRLEGYDNLILGHNLSDKLEWFLMQMTKGAGLVEIFGMNNIDSRKNYTIVRPLIDYSKEEILNYLEQNHIHYFYDDSNDSLDYTRNYFRHTFSNPLLKKYKKGILKTFKILEQEVKLLPEAVLVDKREDYYKFEIDFSRASNLLSSLMKRYGYLLSGAQREEFEDKEEITVLINDLKYVGTYRDGFLYFSPFSEETMPKKFKEKMRVEKIPPKHRAYLFSLEF